LNVSNRNKTEQNAYCSIILSPSIANG